MSSVERSVTPKTPPLRDLGVDETTDTTCETAGTSLLQVDHTPVKAQPPPPRTRGAISAMSDLKHRKNEPEFVDKHLTAPPSPLEFSPEILAAVDRIKNAPKETDIYVPLQTLLTDLSRVLYGTLPPHDKERLRKLHGIPEGKPGHLTFLKMSDAPPTHFPSAAVDLSKPLDAPDILAAYDVDLENPPTSLPYHLVEGIVECKSKENSKGLDQALAYSYRHQQARLDHPESYCLTVKQGQYMIIVSGPSCIISSRRYTWDEDLSPLAAYVYSHYVPPSHHPILDNSVEWVENQDQSKPPTWSIRCGSDLVTEADFIHIGSPWRRRTGALKGVIVKNEQRLTVAVKDYFRHYKRRFKEEDILRHIHQDGDVPGFVRLCSSQELPIHCGTVEDGTLRKRVRLSLWDTGEHLLQAKTVNDLLMAVYDALEVHRTIYLKRDVLHRDMSAFNILMYPKWADLKGRKVMPDAPPLIGHVLAGTTGPVEGRHARCLLIDGDNSAILKPEYFVSGAELGHRTGTPTFISRSVCVGEVYISPLSTGLAFGMPELTGDALALYKKVHPARYNKYPPELNRGSATQHGFLPPRGPIDPAFFETDIKFVHRPEHDVESVFWTMLHDLLLVKPKKPKGTPEPYYASSSFFKLWEPLKSHKIEHNPEGQDGREAIFPLRVATWKAAFHESMKDVAVMLLRIAQQIQTEWALWQGSADAPDHLHEAVQRIILQYLVDHKHSDVELVPGETRSTRKDDDPDDMPNVFGSTENTRGTRRGPSGRHLPIEPPVRSTGSKESSKTTSTKKRKAREAPATAEPSGSAVASPSTGPTAGESSNKRRRGPSSLSVVSHHDNDAEIDDIDADTAS